MACSLPMRGSGHVDSQLIITAGGGRCGFLQHRREVHHSRLLEASAKVRGEVCNGDIYINSSHISYLDYIILNASYPVYTLLNMNVEVERPRLFRSCSFVMRHVSLGDDRSCFSAPGNKLELGLDGSDAMGPLPVQESEALRARFAACRADSHRCGAKGAAATAKDHGQWRAWLGFG